MVSGLLANGRPGTEEVAPSLADTGSATAIVEASAQAVVPMEQKPPQITSSPRLQVEQVVAPGGGPGRSGGVFLHPSGPRDVPMEGRCDRSIHRSLDCGWAEWCLRHAFAGSPTAGADLRSVSRPPAPPIRSTTPRPGECRPGSGSPSPLRIRSEPRRSPRPLPYPLRDRLDRPHLRRRHSDLPSHRA